MPGTTLAAWLVLASAPAALNDSTNYTPRWSPDGKHIAFARSAGGQWDLYRVGSDGSGLEQLTFTPGNEREPSWSPDGRSIAFDRTVDGNRDIAVLDLATKTITRLTRESGVDKMSAWSFDGRRLVFVSDRDGRERPWTMARDGSGARPVPIGRTFHDVLRPAWFPNGRRIAFTMTLEASAGSEPRQVFAVDVDGTNLQAFGAPGVDANPAVSPDGARIAFDSHPQAKDDTSAGGWELFAVDVDGTRRVRLTHDDRNDWSPAWSPDGRRIAFCSGLDNQYEIYVMDADGSNHRRLTFLVYPR